MKASVKTQILVPTLSMMAIGLLTVGGSAAMSRLAMQEDMFQKKVDLTSQLVLSGSANAMWQFDDGMAKETLAPATSDPDFRAGALFDDKGNTFYTIGDATALKELTKTGEASPEGAFIVKSVPLLRTEDGKTMTIGHMAIAFDTSAAAASSTRSMLTMAALAIGVLLASCLVLFLILSRLVRPISNLSQVMRRMSDGHYEQDVPGLDRRDELGEMARAVGVLRDNSLKAISLEGETADMRVRAEASRAREQERIQHEADQLRRATEILGTSLEKLAAGDLTCHIEQGLAKDYEPIRLDFNRAVDQLRSAIKSVMSSVENIDVGTNEIAAGADSLSKRTEQQAAAIEETAAALDEITSNVTSSTKRTEETRAVSNRANTAAVQSTLVVAKAEDAMQRIEKSSQQISNIIGVIDEIAFQTNLLALNAGVEAARAGEAGKGFAVVAQEVRELAQRSAQAAKEIKALITTSAGEVDSGVQLVRATGTSLKEISQDIAEINRHVDAIALSAREQATGLSEINTAINHMDHSTQQNAAMVEESSAASATLAGEATKLRDLVSSFRVDDYVRDLQDTAHRMSQPSRASVANPSSVRAQAPRRVANGGFEEF